MCAADEVALLLGDTVGAADPGDGVEADDAGAEAGAEVGAEGDVDGDGADDAVFVFVVVGVVVIVGVVAGGDVGDGVVGAGLGVIVLVTHGCGEANGRAALAVPESLVLTMVTAVVAMTAPAMHKPVATPATADPCLRTLTRLTPFLRSSVEGSSFTRYRHPMGYPPVARAASVVPADLSTRAGPARTCPRAKARGAGTAAPGCRAVTWSGP
jgi:hypothetical protein